MTIEVLVTVLPHGEGLDLPAYATPGAAACDLRAAVAEPMTLAPGQRALVPTGIAMAVPEGYEGQVRMRSGLALEKGLILPNAPGTIDSDYRGEIRVVVANISGEPVVIERGDRIAQLVIAPVARARFEKVDALPESGRGGGGFGSTGKS
ncbi:MAG: dUTP diphosphatase [Thermoanaerobaculia bacterium]